MFGKRCESCSGDCEECEHCDYCTKCNPGLYLRKDNGYCYPSCPGGYTNNGATMTCTSNTCHGSCATCNGPLSSNCESCNGLDKLYKGTCIPSCPANISVLVGSVCEECHSTCATCSGVTETECTSCSGNLFLDGTRCVSECPATTYKNIATNTCDPCHGSCLTCSGPADDECVTCSPPTRLNDFKCDQTTCLPGLVYNAQLNLCEECP